MRWADFKVWQKAAVMTVTLAVIFIGSSFGNHYFGAIGNVFGVLIPLGVYIGFIMWTTE